MIIAVDNDRRTVTRREADSGGNNDAFWRGAWSVLFVQLVVAMVIALLVP